jgi:hypothetical protein
VLYRYLRYQIVGMKRTLLLLCLVANLMSANAQKQQATELFNWMTGSFHSGAQAKTDTSYFDISLHMYPIWEADANAYWLYVEQAMTTALNRPYRQRVYKIYGEGGKLVSKVYEIKSANKFINGWKNKELLTHLTPDSLIDRQGCAIYLTKAVNLYKGSTPGKECLSSLRGASYATSEVEIFSDKLLSWDRGWSAADKQVWGAEKGGYIFIKQN